MSSGINSSNSNNIDNFENKEIKKRNKQFTELQKNDFLKTLERFNNIIKNSMPEKSLLEASLEQKGKLSKGSTKEKVKDELSQDVKSNIEGEINLDSVKTLDPSDPRLKIIINKFNKAVSDLDNIRKSLNNKNDKLKHPNEYGLTTSDIYKIKQSIINEKQDFLKKKNLAESEFKSLIEVNKEVLHLKEQSKNNKESDQIINSQIPDKQDKETSTKENVENLDVNPEQDDIIIIKKASPSKKLDINKTLPSNEVLQQADMLFNSRSHEGSALSNLIQRSYSSIIKTLPDFNIVPGLSATSIGEDAIKKILNISTSGLLFITDSSKASSVFLSETNINHKVNAGLVLIEYLKFKNKLSQKYNIKEDKVEEAEINLYSNDPRKIASALEYLEERAETIVLKSIDEAVRRCIKSSTSIGSDVLSAASDSIDKTSDSSTALENFNEFINSLQKIKGKEFQPPNVDNLKKSISKSMDPIKKDFTTIGKAAEKALSSKTEKERLSNIKNFGMSISKYDNSEYKSIIKGIYEPLSETVQEFSNNTPKSLQNYIAQSIFTVSEELKKLEEDPNPGAIRRFLNSMEYKKSLTLDLFINKMKDDRKSDYSIKQVTIMSKDIFDQTTDFVIKKFKDVDTVNSELKDNLLAFDKMLNSNNTLMQNLSINISVNALSKNCNPIKEKIRKIQNALLDGFMELNHIYSNGSLSKKIKSLVNYFSIPDRIINNITTFVSEGMPISDSIDKEIFSILNYLPKNSIVSNIQSSYKELANMANSIFRFVLDKVDVKGSLQSLVQSLNFDEIGDKISDKIIEYLSLSKSTSTINKTNPQNTFEQNKNNLQHSYEKAKEALENEEYAYTKVLNEVKESIDPESISTKYIDDSLFIISNMDTSIKEPNKNIFNISKIATEIIGLIDEDIKNKISKITDISKDIHKANNIFTSAFSVLYIATETIEESILNNFDYDNRIPDWR